MTVFISYNNKKGFAVSSVCISWSVATVPIPFFELYGNCLRDQNKCTYTIHNNPTGHNNENGDPSHPYRPASATIIFGKTHSKSLVKKELIKLLEAEDKQKSELMIDAITKYSSKPSNLPELPAHSQLSHSSSAELSLTQTATAPAILCTGHGDLVSAAGVHCTIKVKTLTNRGHEYKNCFKPMHGALCGCLWDERGPECNVTLGSLNKKGQEKMLTIGALICLTCMGG